MIARMSPHLARFYRVLTAAGPDTWIASQLKELLQRVENREKVPYAFILHKNAHQGRPRAWGAVIASLPEDREFVLVKRSPVALEAEICIEYISAPPGKFMRPRDTETAKELLRGVPGDRAQHTLQGALRALFGLQKDRPFEMFEASAMVASAPRRRDKANKESNLGYQFVPDGRDFLVVLGDAPQPAEERPIVTGPAPGVGAAESKRKAIPRAPVVSGRGLQPPKTRPDLAVPDLVVEATKSQAEAKRQTRARSPRRTSLRLSLEAWDRGNGEIDCDLAVGNRINAPNALGKLRLTVDGQQLPWGGTIMREGAEYDDFLQNQTVLQIDARSTVRASVCFELPKGLSFRRGALVVLEAVDLDDAVALAETRLLASRQEAVPATPAEAASTRSGAPDIVHGRARARPRAQLLSSKRRPASDAPADRK